MRLGIDAREIQDGVYTGIGRPLVNFLRYFAKHALQDECILFSSRKIPIQFGGNIRNEVLPEAWRQYWDQVTLAQAARRYGIDLFYSPYYKLPLAISCRSVCAVFDLMYLILPEYKRQLSPWVRVYYRTMGRRYLQKADRVLTCSQYSKKDIVDFYKIDTEKVEIIPLSVSGIYRREPDVVRIEAMKKRYGIDRPYLLYVGNFKFHKNVRNVILAFHKVCDRFADYKLVLAGPKEHLYSELEELTDRMGLRGRVIFTGKVAERDEPHLLYSGATAFVMPSLYEGFGLPPAEAMACGVPVVASNTTSIPEVVRDAGLLVDPEDTNAIAEAIGQILSKPDLRQAMTEKGFAYAKGFEETAVAKQQYDFFKRVLKS